MRELWACAGTEFHADVVAALSYTLTGLWQPAQTDPPCEDDLPEARSA